MSANGNRTGNTVRTKGEQEIVQAVRERYAGIARGRESGCCPATTSCCDAPTALATALGYRFEELQALPEGANLGLGCGAPVEVLDLEAGETVLDLGAGAGVDVLIAARQVGPQGRVIGVDMTAEMIARARTNASSAGADNVELREGRLEALPVEDASIDAVTSNCVINLVPDKLAVFREVARVLRPGGRMAVSDIVLDGGLPEAVADDLLAYVGCVAGALERDAYFGLLREAGLSGIRVVKDVDFLAFVGDALPAEVQAMLDRTGVRLDDLRGRVRSVTYLARKASQ